MTPSTARVAQASQGMQWERVEIAAVESAEGYRILAQRIDGGWCYSAFGPEEKTVQKNGSRFFRDTEYKMKYAMGERMPPPYSYQSQSARESIGYFHESEHGNTASALAAAKAACDIDLEIQLEK